MKLRKVAIITNHLACDSNTKYFSVLEKYFLSNGWIISTDFNVDLVVFSTCGFHNRKFTIIKNVLNELYKIGFPEDKIVMMGCLPKTHENDLRAIFNGRIINFNTEEILDQIINAQVSFSQIKNTNIIKASNSSLKSDRELFNIIIAEGCLKQCTFCVVNKAHGYIKSEAQDEIEKQFRLAVSNGYKDICLSGTDTFAYGYDNGTNIIGLITHLLSIEPDVRFYMGNLHVRWLVEYQRGIEDLIRRKIINYLHIVLQHVNPYMLKRMGRPTKFSECYDIVRRLKEINPTLYLKTDIIVGFHGETEDIYNELKDFIINDKYFNYINIFEYSDVKGAPANSLDGKLHFSVKHLRYLELMKLVEVRNRINSISENENYQASHAKEIAEFEQKSKKGYHFCFNTYKELNSGDEAR